MRQETAYDYWKRKAQPSCILQNKVIEQERQLSPSTRRHIAGKLLLRNNPELMDVEIEELIGAGTGSVGRWRKQLQDDGAIPVVDVRMGLDGELNYTSRKVQVIEFTESEHIVLSSLKDAIIKYQETDVPEGKNPAARYMSWVKENFSGNTYKHAQSALNKVATECGYSDWTTFPWWSIRTVDDAKGVLSLLNRTVPKKSTVRGYWSKLLRLFQESRDLELISDGELQRIREIQLPKLKTGQTEKKPEVPVGHWIELHKSLDLANDLDWMNCAMLCMLFPLGMRPSDFLDLKRSVFSNMDVGYVELYRKKNDMECGFMLDVYPAVQTVIKKWLSIVPSGQEYLWYRASNKRDVLWDEPWEGDFDTFGASVYSRIAPIMKRIDPVYSPRCGRISYKTYAELAKLPSWMVDLNGGWQPRERSASWTYFRGKTPQMLGEFSRVAEFVAFDRALWDIILPKLENVEPVEVVIEDAPKFCTKPTCTNVIPPERRDDMDYCSDACRQWAYRQRKRAEAEALRLDE